jgi:hypothetical protein
MLALNGAADIFAPVIDYIKGEAEAGAKQAIPEIEQKVKDTVMPLIMPVILLTAGSFIISLLAYREARRARAGKALSGRRR